MTVAVLADAVATWGYVAAASKRQTAIPAEDRPAETKVVMRAAMRGAIAQWKAKRSMEFEKMAASARAAVMALVVPA